MTSATVPAITTPRDGPAIPGYRRACAKTLARVGGSRPQPSAALPDFRCSSSPIRGSPIRGGTAGTDSGAGGTAGLGATPARRTAARRSWRCSCETRPAAARLLHCPVAEHEVSGTGEETGSRAQCAQWIRGSANHRSAVRRGKCGALGHRRITDPPSPHPRSRLAK